MLVDTDMGRLIRLHLPKLGGTIPPALAMPEEYRSNDPVESYRLYYRLDKQHLLKYSKRERPDWLGE